MNSKSLLVIAAVALASGALSSCGGSSDSGSGSSPAATTGTAPQMADIADKGKCNYTAFTETLRYRAMVSEQSGAGDTAWADALQTANEKVNTQNAKVKCKDGWMVVATLNADCARELPKADAANFIIEKPDPEVYPEATRCTTFTMLKASPQSPTGWRLTLPGPEAPGNDDSGQVAQVKTSCTEVPKQFQLQAGCESTSAIADEP